MIVIDQPKGLIKWFKRLLCVVRTYNKDRYKQWERIKALEQIIADRTELNVDMSPSMCNQNHVIVVGRYRNMDYIEVFTIAPGEFEHIICTLRHMERFGTVRRIDAPIAFRAIIERQL